VALPAEVAAVLPEDTARNWEVIAPIVPEGAYLAGGTALAVHLRHRVSRDLDFFFQRPVNLDEVAAALQSRGPFAVSLRDTGTLNGVFSQTRVQFLSAENQHQLEPTTTVAGIDVAGLGDILAMKLKVIGDRGELRDYFDVMQVERQARRTAEEGLGLYMARYGVPPEHITIRHIVAGLGYFDDVADDDALPVSRDEIVSYWRKRQPELIRNIGRFPPRSG
jgi:hypothetical protein